MGKDEPLLDQRPDGSRWMRVDAESPLGAAVSEIEVVPERQRWMAAPRFSSRRFLARPVHRRIGLIRAAILLVRECLRPRDDIAERLRDIEELIVAGHNDAADRQIDRLRGDYPSDEVKARVLGLVSLNLYDRGNAGKAQYIHECALLCGAAHPAMIEIFGSAIRGPDPD